jgi:hypothetical protein
LKDKDKASNPACQTCHFESLRLPAAWRFSTCSVCVVFALFVGK